MTSDIVIFHSSGGCKFQVQGASEFSAWLEFTSALQIAVVWLDPPKHFP